MILKQVSTFSQCLLMLYLLLLSSGCSTVSFDQPKTASQCLQNPSSTQLGKGVSKWSQKHDGLSGFYPLSQGMDALGVRLRLLELAEKSIDIQTFLMKEDSAGAVVIAGLLKAADRGVRVRFLLDDIFTSASDSHLYILNEHPNIEVRLFNPVSRRGWSKLNLLADFKQANRRMHNKSFTVDNSVSVIGGRNIADEYFQLKINSDFIDFDIISLGPIVHDISNSFDEFWNHSRAVPIEQVVKSKSERKLKAYRDKIDLSMASLYPSVYERAFESVLLRDLFAGQVEFYKAESIILADSPDKLVNEIGPDHRIVARGLSEVLENARSEVIFVTPYFVPGSDLVERLKKMSESAIRVVVLTNSLASTNHIAVHSAYDCYRVDLLEAGVELYELRANAANDESNNLTLHSKVIVIDRRYLFIGSLNVDPRSIVINAEMGVLIDSKKLAESFLSKESKLIDISYRVTLTDKGTLEWLGHIHGEAVLERKEPLTNQWRRFKAWFLKILPESQL